MKPKEENKADTDHLVFSPPSLQPRLSEIKRQKEYERAQWHSCCSNKPTDPRLIRYISQLGFGIVVCSFSMAQLYSSTKCEDTTLYSSILTGVIGFFLPGPRTT